jgi:cellulose synthase (UDP-forming)
MREPDLLKDDDPVHLLLKRGAQEYTFPCVITRAFGIKVGLRMHQLTVAQHIDFIQCTFARADTWALWQDGFPEDKPIESLRDVLALGFRGYVHMASYTPPVIRNVLVGLTSLIAWIASFVPHGVGKNQVPSSQGQTVAQH